MPEISQLDIAEIEDLEIRRCRALAAVDLAALDAMFSESLTHVHTTGLVQNKAEFLAGLAAKRPFINVVRGPLHFRFLGECAVVTGTMTNTVRRPGQSGPVLIDAYATQIVVREGTDLKYVHFQATNGPRLTG